MIPSVDGLEPSAPRPGRTSPRCTTGRRVAPYGLDPDSGVPSPGGLAAGDEEPAGEAHGDLEGIPGAEAAHGGTHGHPEGLHSVGQR